MEKKRIGEMLIGDNVITEDQLEEALEIQKKKWDYLGCILVDLGYLETDILLDYLKQQGTIVKIKKRK